MDAAQSTDFEDYEASAERREGLRHVSVLRVGRLSQGNEDQLCMVRNVSAGGMMIECNRPPQVGERIVVELRSDKQMPGTVRWITGGNAGVQFDAPVDVGQLLREEKNSLLRVRPRAPRFIREGTAKLIGEGEPVEGQIGDIAVGGMSLRVEEKTALRRGDPVVVSIEGLGATTGEVRWIRETVLGVRFEKPLSYRAFADWLDRRRPGLQALQSVA